MPEFGSDQQRGGWYDVVDRVRGKDHEATRFTWHDRKAWWQQEQAILAYQIMAGSTGDDEALRLGREAAAFYNAFFFDYEEGSVYFNVLANGIPYLLGTERQKGSHSMAGYHSFELAFLVHRLQQPAHHQGADGPLVQPAPGRRSRTTPCASRRTSCRRAASGSARSRWTASRTPTSMPTA